MDRDPFDLVGDVLDGQFRVDAFAGEGDLSVVYKGHHLGVDATVAIKCLNLPETLDPALARPLVDGFREASRVHYRLARGNLHIAQTIASGSTLVPRSGVVVPYLVREWYEGESLRSDLARRQGEMRTGRPLDEVLALLETAFDGVAHAHAQGEVHLSLNPSNLFVVAGAGSKPPSLKVLDFGVASTMNALPGVAANARPSAGLRLLFPAYAAPEQLDRTVGALGPWTDVYALALVMMEMLSDRVVMAETDSGAIVEHALDEQRRPTPQAHGLKLPSHVDRALVRAVARAPERRQKTAADLWKDVRNTVRTVAPRAMSSAPLPAPSLAPPVLPLPTPPPARARAISLPPPVPADVRPAPALPPAAPATTALGSVPPRTPLQPLAPPPPPSGDPPPAAPSASGPIEPWPLPIRRLPRGLALLRSPEAVALALPMAGAFFWSALGVVFLMFVTAPLRRSSEPGPSRPTDVAAAAPAPSTPTPSPRSSASPPPLPPLPSPSSPPSPSPASPSAAVGSAPASATPPPTSPPQSEPIAAAPAVAANRAFRGDRAILALDGKWRDVAKCRRGKTWGKGTTTITFAGDGSVRHVDVGWPFAGTPTADCIADRLGTTRVDPFGGDDAALAYKVYVAPH